MPNANEIQMLQAARAAGITSRDELANLMAQTSHESSGFTSLEEGFRYTRSVDQIPVRSVLREGREVAEAARLEALNGRPQELARLMYGNRLGNDDAGDGYLYRGRGYIQLTGEAIYREAGTSLNLDLVAHPELAVNRDNAANIAVWYWQHRVPQADRDDVTNATHAINGGENGLADRHNRFDAWYAQLTPEFMNDLAAGRVRPGNAVAPVAGQDAMADNALRRFETGEDVRQLRDHLQALGIRYDRNHVLGAGNVYDGHTEEAVRRFQQQHDLPITGRAGPETLTAIQTALQHREQNPQQGMPHQNPEHPAAPQQPRPGAPQMRGPGGHGGPDQNGRDREDREHEQDRHAPPQRRGAQLITDPDHVAHSTLREARIAMERADLKGFDGLDQTQRDRLTAGIAAGALADTKTNITQITRVDASDKIDPQTGRPLYLIPGQGDPNTDYYRRVGVPVEQTLNTPIEKLSDVAKTAVETREQIKTQELAQAPTLNQDGPSGPTMKIGPRVS